MSAPSVSIAAMFGWVVDSFRLFGKNHRSLVSASLITIGLVVVMLIPMWIAMGITMTQAMKTGGMPAPGMPMAGDLTMFYTVYGITILVSLFLFPPLLVGWFRLCENIDQNNAARGLDILKPYKDQQLWLRGIGFALLALAIYAVVYGLFAAVFWGAIADFMQQVEAQQAAAIMGAKPAPPNFSMGLVFGYFGFIGVSLFLQFAYMLGFAEISLRPTAPIVALKQAGLGVFKNVLKLLLFLFCAGMVFYFAIIIISLILGLIVVVLSFIHPVVGAVGAIVLFSPVLLCLYPLMFAGHYFMWKSILGGNEPALPSTPDVILSA